MVRGLAGGFGQRHRRLGRVRRACLADTVPSQRPIHQGATTLGREIISTLGVAGEIIVPRTKEIRVEIVIDQRAPAPQRNGRGHDGLEALDNIEKHMTDETVMIGFPLDENGEIENMYALKMRNGDYVIDNIPFYAYGVSCGDKVTAKHVCGRLIFDKIKKRGGHSTYRVKLQPGANHGQFLARWPPFDSVGCGYEGSDLGERRLYAIDVPSEADVERIYSWLEKGEQDGLWDFEEGHYSGDPNGDAD